jgi:hypothetical protein
VSTFSRYAAALVLLATGIIGLHNGVTEYPDGVNTGQRLVTVGVFIYGILGLTAAAGVVRRRRWGVTLTALWGVDVTLVGSGAVAVYSDGEGRTIGFISAFLACMLAALLVWWLARRSMEPAGSETRPMSQSGQDVSASKVDDLLLLDGPELPILAHDPAVAAIRWWPRGCLGNDDMRPISTRLQPSLPVQPARDTRAPLTQELSVRQTADGSQIVVRRVVAAGAEGQSRTLHIDAIVR